MFYYILTVRGERDGSLCSRCGRPGCVHVVVSTTRNESKVQAPALQVAAVVVSQVFRVFLLMYATGVTRYLRQ